MSNDGASTPGRPLRLRNKPGRYGDFLTSPTKRIHEEEVESSEDEYHEVHNLQKPTGDSYIF